jgi:hypothetical protein
MRSCHRVKVKESRRQVHAGLAPVAGARRCFDPALGFAAFRPLSSSSPPLNGEILCVCVCARARASLINGVLGDAFDLSDGKRKKFRDNIVILLVRDNYC